jgi:ABC-type oligopeptide transport system substrate-binding subunit
MKKINFIKSCLIIVLLAVMSSCGKEEVVLTGKLKVTYYNHSTNFSMIIRPAENTSVNIVDNLKFATGAGTLTYELNAGNYVLIAGGDNFTGANSTGFQIKAGETTEIIF